MKKSFAILLAVLFCLSLSACTLEIKTGGAGEQAPTSAPATTSTGSATAPVGDATSKNGGNQVTSATATQTSSGALLTRDQALAIALQAAGLTKADVRDVDAELDREWGATLWEVDFESGTTEYSYDVDAYTGQVVKREKERD